MKSDLIEIGTEEICEVNSSVKPGVWHLIVWDDPVNLMSYVTWVFTKVFGYPKSLAHELMLKVHLEGKCVVKTGNREQLEVYLLQLLSYGLWATLQTGP